MNEKSEYHCCICIKNYSSKSSLCNHTKKFHSKNVINKKVKKYQPKSADTSAKNQPSISQISAFTFYACRFCKKEYKHIQSRWKHEVKCKEENEIHKIKEENEILRRERDQKNQEIIKLQKKLLSSKRLDNKTFKAVNKILMDRSNSNNITNSNNVINNNYPILSLGNEELTNVLTMDQKKQIMNSRLGSLEKIVEITHCGELNQFKNIIITNLKDNYAYRYDDKVGYFVTVPKTDLLEDVIMNRVMDIETIYDELQSANKINEKTKKLIQDFLDKMANNDEPFFDNETKYENFKSYKTNNIKILLYNNQDRITKDIALLIKDDVEPKVENIMV